jgi:hypothetical protein
LSPLVFEEQVKMLTGLLSSRDRILCDNAAIVLHFNVQAIVWEDATPQLQDLGKTFRSQTMFGVVPNMGLEQDRFSFAGHTSAIDKILYCMANFGHVRVSRNRIAIR